MSDELKRLVEAVLAKLGVEATVTIQDRETTYYVGIDSPDSSLLIGRAGETLEALQTVIRLMAYRLELGEARLVIDVNAYRRNREEELITMVNEVGERVKQNGLPETLRPMSSYERRLVHQIIGEMGGLTTESWGEGTDRRITIRPV